MPRPRRISWRSRLKFGRRKRVRVGTFVEPPLRPLLPIEDVVADGVTLTLSAVRLSIKNRIIVAALRDREDFDTLALSTFAREELLRLAEESDETASRLEHEPEEVPHAAERPVRLLAHEDRVRRPRVQRELADALRDSALDESLLEELVKSAQDSASDELRRALSTRLVTQRFDLDPNYSTERATRLRALVAIDLEQLQEPPSY